MSNRKLLIWSFVNSVGVLVYVSMVATIIQNGEKIFGEMKNFAGPIAFLLLFVFSALVTGFLVLGRPAYLFLDGFKREAVKMLLYTAGWMFLITVIALGANVILK